MMKRIIVSLLAVSVGSIGLFGMVGSSTAFQTQQVGANIAQGATVASKQLDLEATDKLPEDGSESSVAIPGLGVLGVLPKLDFGLELLYGDNPGAQSAVPEDDPVEDAEGLRIRGTFKHRF